jgi:hypothetical protein
MDHRWFRVTSTCDCTKSCTCLDEHGDVARMCKVEAAYARSVVPGPLGHAAFCRALLRS